MKNFNLKNSILTKVFVTPLILILTACASVTEKPKSTEPIPNIKSYVGTWETKSCEGIKNLSPQKIELTDNGTELLLTYLSKDTGNVINLSTKPQVLIKEHKKAGNWPQLKQVTERQIVGDQVVIAAIYYPMNSSHKGTAISTALTKLSLNSTGDELVYERNGIGEEKTKGFYNYNLKCLYAKKK